MASLEQRFRAIQRENPNHSSLINFGRAIKGQNLSFNRRVFYFKKLVDSEDYAKEDYREVRDVYCSKNTYAETRVFQGIRSENRTKTPLGKTVRSTLQLAF